MRSGRISGATHDVSVSLPIFEAGKFTGTQPGSLVARASSSWSLYAGPQFTADAGQDTNLAFRPGADGIPFIALPRIVGPAASLIFRDGFEAE